MPMPAELRALIERFNRVGCLLGGVDEDALQDGDATALASAKLIVSEMNRVKAQIDASIDRARLERSRH